LAPVVVVVVVVAVVAEGVPASKDLHRTYN
jgi:hypothetical protein